MINRTNCFSFHVNFDSGRSDHNFGNTGRFFGPESGSRRRQWWLCIDSRWFFSAVNQQSVFVVGVTFRLYCYVVCDVARSSSLISAFCVSPIFVLGPHWLSRGFSHRGGHFPALFFHSSHICG